MSRLPADAPEVLNSEVDPHGFEISVWDVVLGTLTIPLLPWVLMYAVTGSERILATRAARLRLYLWLLLIEAVLVLICWWWFTR